MSRASGGIAGYTRCHICARAHGRGEVHVQPVNNGRYAPVTFSYTKITSHYLTDLFGGKEGYFASGSIGPVKNFGTGSIWLILYQE